MVNGAAYIGGGLAALAVAILVATFTLTAPVVGDAASVNVMPPSVDATESVDLTLVEIFENTEASVVRLTVSRNATGEMDLNRNGVGSGIVFDKMGHIITNAHVVEDSLKTEVTFLDGLVYEAEIVGVDTHTDLAVVRVDTEPELLQPLTLANSSTLKVGQQVAAIGNPFGLSGSMSSGIVSQLNRLLPDEDTGFSIPDVIQTDAAINPGNSGGPLLNMRGELIGVNTAIQTNTGNFNGVGFAVPSQTVTKIIPTLILEGKYDHPWIGVSGLDINPRLAKILNLTESRGFLIIDVIEDSPASRAGLIGSNTTVIHEGDEVLVGGDILIRVDDIDVRKISDILIHLQRSKAVGDELAVQLLRDGNLIEETLILDKRPGE
ncbi:MAG: trypsin-like serine protease [Cenarchaeum sp. SB0665_bin_23]|nr:trypsin-like serine protease [Cenarchaeum sp. SB0667_bin_13]MXY60841.1 trypsin-like serine protease [Cenarchaeum sp. SB0665_bin_23]MXZ93545.1 trypsin-like serine protease [Cenarchaeum sp. SB0666_bin_15]MYC79889.1 trypsin-like serine protease [Cenarchaeum sp. SB0661_bin_35]MYD58754.1 trypsin-like serine protease [Cenarchaeum sp. SB0678_bin_8]MYG33335.1 trypsin-like serine protease [Cenarchaeum sp. SB0677_bin_16]MYI51734.1 trypsin-like serine protease [Cenarchaeum sp. SB0673_bin_9]MYJ28335.